MRDAKLPKVVVILGPTAAGKTQWSIQLAKQFHGSVISADSRQIYKKMDIGTAKPTGERLGLRRSLHVDGVPHHMIDIIDPGKKFTVAQFRDRALKYIKLATKNNRLPIVAGGTGLYISALVDNYTIPRIPENKKLRQSLESKTAAELMTLLTSLDPGAAKTMDPKNKRRIIRALEVCILSGEPYSAQRLRGEPLIDVLQIGITVPRDTLHQRINTRVDEMMKLGLLKEVEQLMKQKYSWELPSMSGVGYRQFQGFFEGRHSLDECIELLKRDTRRFARRQCTWFRRDKRIQWVERYDEALALVKEFLKK